MQTARTRKPKAADRGRYKLAVYFIDHKEVNGKPYYFHSTARQDKNNISLNRFKRMVTKKWSGRINWAAIYENEVMICEFKDEQTGWELR